MELPANFIQLYSKEDIACRVKELGEEMRPWIRQAETAGNSAVLAVCVLRGATFFYSDLLRAFSHSVETDYLRVSAYTDDSVQRSAAIVSYDLLEVSGRAVLLIDEICDTGGTLKKLSENFLSRGAIDVKAAVAVVRAVSNPKYIPEWTAFTYQGEEWLVGYGMDSSNLYRNASAIYRIEK